MKNLTQMLALAVLVSFSSCEEDKPEDKGMEMGNLYVSNSKPQPGEEIYIRYTKKDSVMPDAMVSYLKGNDFYPQDIELKDSANAYYGKVSIPDTIHAIAFNFKKDEKYDTNNDKGYVLSLYDENGKEMPHSMATKGVYLSNAASLFDLKVEKDSAFSYMEKAVKMDSSIREDYDTYYANALLSLDKEKGDSYIAERIDYYKKKDSLNSENYSTLVALYNNKNDKAKADSISQVAITKFPKGEMAKRELMMKVVQSPELEDKLKHLETYNQKIGTAGYEKDIMLRYIASAYADKKDWENFKKYASKIDDPRTQAGIYNSVAWDLAEKGENLELASEISAKSLELLDAESTLEKKPDMWSKKQFRNSLEYGRAMYADTYALVKYKQGDLEKAIEIQKQAISEKSSADANTRYVQFLTEAGHDKKAIKEAEDFIKDNRASAEMEDYLKTAYTRENPNQDFDGFLVSLKEEALANQRMELKKDMINEEAPSFKLKDLQGNEITLADLKGKTVILDFWATWCGPCKMSFPGMQKAVEKYKDQENVEFFFVNTWENGENRKEDVSKFIKENNYSFHVLMDEPVTEGSREFLVVSDFEISGIPTKIIIGPDGRINFKSVGYDGNNAKLLQEIGLMIELTQENESPQA
ncbi:hypothetical protein GCM10023115_44370 [Pontixanthobacter gangjinensis]|uniref:Redoxin domain-containing protein n=1 Tax=Christiangramia aestuarii TaxID=1028746 RepID=A0A7M3SXY9_9FLAO|nr:TlpA disulfide reductase family protein [Christiangramia aestuarii]MUP41470.1 redoxin domain-containing protein [Christiangramia aestuarii]